MHIQVVCYLYYCVCVKSELLLLGDNILEGGGGGEQGIFRPYVLCLHMTTVLSSCARTTLVVLYTCMLVSK